MREEVRASSSPLPAAGVEVARPADACTPPDVLNSTAERRENAVCKTRSTVAVVSGASIPDRFFELLEHSPVLQLPSINRFTSINMSVTSGN
jgi:hypothetical protein